MSKRSVQATKDGLQTLKQAKASKQDDDGRRLTYERIAAKAGLDTKTVKTFFYGRRVDTCSAVAITEKALGMKLTDVVPPIESEQPSVTLEPEQTTPDWRNICLAMLEQQRATQIFRRKATERGFELNVYVPRGLIERKQQQRRSGDVSLEQVYELDKEVITKEYQHDDFLKEVIGQEPIQAGKCKDIAIIGEPGAGKTTQLEKIAAWIQKNDLGLPICIALADLQGQTLKDYLLQTWLKRALPLIRKLSPTAVPDLLEIPQALQAALADVFCEARVWLLLDGVDEMEVASPVQALATIQAQLTDWLASARVVLTCRLNVWDARVNNPLTGFDTYCTLEFAPAQVEEFIQKWFACAKESDRGKQLQTKLKEAGRERIRELVKNPLRLALLCQTFYLDNQGELPKTKAELYRGFTEYFYEWKQEQYEQKYKQPLTNSTQRELNEALGKLALAGINSAAKFRLGKNLAYEVMGERLFNLACDLGWLNLVDRETGTPEAVYAFFHPTFQEYFAAKAIKDWKDFLDPEQGIYRLFEPQWKEVILLWLGREEVAKEQKEAFIKALVEFEARCESFYGYRAYFLAAAGIAEFENCSLTDEIVVQIFEWGFGDLDIEKQTQRKFIDTIAKQARAALQESDRARAIKSLTELLRPSQHERVRWQAASLLGQISPGNIEAINTLINLLPIIKEHHFRWDIAQSLEDIAFGNKKAIDALTDLLPTIEDKSFRSLIARTLGKIAPDNSDAIQALIQLLETSDGLRDFGIRCGVTDNLEKVGAGSPEVAAALVNLLRTSRNDSAPRSAARILEKIGIGNLEAISLLVNLLGDSQEEGIRLLAIKILGKISADIPDAIQPLSEVLFSQNERIRCQAAESLGLINPNKQNAIKVLNELLSSEDEQIRCQAAESLGLINPNKQNAIEALIQLLSTTQNYDIFVQAIKILGQIGTGNSNAIKTLTELLDPSLEQNIRLQAAKSLVQINPSNQNAIDTVIELLQKPECISIIDDSLEVLGQSGAGNSKAISTLIDSLWYKSDMHLFQAASCLQKIGAGNPQVIAALIELLCISPDEDTLEHWDTSYHREVANSCLKKLPQDDQVPGVVASLKDYLTVEVRKDDSDLYNRCYDIIWHWTQNMSYPDFYQAWHAQLSAPHPEVLETKAVGFNPFTQSRNLTELPRLLTAAIANDAQLSQTIHLVCIDGSKFIDGNNPPGEIYDQMLDQDCPERQNGEPETTQAFKFYWNSLKRKSDRTLILLFYENIAGPARQRFSPTFLNNLSRFDGAIAVVTEQPLNQLPLKWFSPSQPQLIEDIVGWIRAIALENL